MQTFFPSRILYLYISDVFVALLYVSYSTAYLIVKFLTFRLCSFWKDIYNFNQHTHFVISYITFSESILVGIKNSMMTPQNRRLPQPPGMYAFCFLCPSFYFRMNLRDLSLDFVRKWGCDECWKLSENWCHIIRS